MFLCLYTQHQPMNKALKYPKHCLIYIFSDMLILISIFHDSYKTLTGKDRLIDYYSYKNLIILNTHYKISTRGLFHLDTSYDFHTLFHLWIEQQGAYQIYKKGSDRYMPKVGQKTKFQLQRELLSTGKERMNNRFTT